MRYSDKVPGMLLEKAKSDIYFKPTLTAIARYFCVSIQTVHDWKERHKEFAEAVDQANTVVNDDVENSLLKRTHGYDFVETREEIDDEGNTKKVTIHKHMPADPALLKYFLNNRRPADWSDKQEIHQTGTTTTVIVQESDAQML